MVAGQPVSVQVPARATFACEVATPGRSTPGRSATVAYGSRLTRDQRSSALPSRSVSCAATRSTSSRPRTSSSSGTPLETTVRYCPRSGGLPVSEPRSNTQCASEPSSAASGWSSSGRSNQRWTLTIGESSRAGSSSPSRRALSRGGTATTTASASSSSSEDTRASVKTVAPALSSAAPAASPCIRPSGLVGRTRSLCARGPSSAVRTVKSPASGSASSQRRLSAGRMNTSQKRSMDSLVSPSRLSNCPNVSFGCDRAERSRNVVIGKRNLSRRERCEYLRRAGRLGSIAATTPFSSSTGRASRSRRNEPPSPIRSRKRRYSVKQPSAMCCPLSGGGSGSPSRSGSV